MTAIAAQDLPLLDTAAAEARPRPALHLVQGDQASPTHDVRTAEWDVTDASQLSTERLDEVARAIATAAAQGELDERECTHRIASLIATSRILDEVARYQVGLNDQQRVDLADSLRWSLVNTVLDTERGFFDLDRMRTASFSGWLRQTGVAFASRDSVVRPRTLAERNTVLWAITPGSNGVDDEPNAWHNLDTADSAERQATAIDFADLLGEPERLLAKTKQMRTSTRVFATAVEVRRALDLPRLCVPATETDRQWVLQTCEQDPAAAGRSLRTMVDVLCGVGDPDTVDERMLALWDDFPLERLQVLEAAPDELIHILVVGHVMPAPKPSRGALREMRRCVKDLCPARDWQQLASPLVASYVARTTSPVSDFDSTSDEVARLAMAAEARKLADQWPTLVARAVAWPGAPLGVDEDEVDARLGQMLHELIEGD